jgi:hypothetical protein
MPIWSPSLNSSPAEGVFLDIIGTKILRLLLLAIHRGVLSKDFWLGGHWDRTGSPLGQGHALKGLERGWAIKKTVCAELEVCIMLLPVFGMNVLFDF